MPTYHLHLVDTFGHKLKQILFLFKFWINEDQIVHNKIYDHVREILKQIQILKA
jgi:hypothetical protein